MPVHRARGQTKPVPRKLDIGRRRRAHFPARFRVATVVTTVGPRNCAIRPNDRARSGKRTGNRWQTRSTGFRLGSGPLRLTAETASSQRTTGSAKENESSPQLPYVLQMNGPRRCLSRSLDRELARDRRSPNPNRVQGLQRTGVACTPSQRQTPA